MEIKIFVFIDFWNVKFIHTHPQFLTPGCSAPRLTLWKACPNALKMFITPGFL